MTVEYVVLGAVLVVMGAVQMWLRYGPWAKEQKELEAALVQRRSEKAKASAREGGVDAEARSAEEAPERTTVILQRGSRVWTTWTAILGPLGMIFGLVLVVLGVLGV
jgi:Tfp pilus assembly protein PilN